MRSAVGLAIRANWVEVIEVRRGLKKSATVAKFGRFPLVSSDKTKVVEGIQGVLEAAKIKAKEVVLAIPTQEVILRYFTLPALPKNEWAGAIQFEARKYIPFKLEELVWDFHATERKAQRQLDVIFVATRKEVYLEYMALLKQAGLTASVVEAASFSLARALTHTQPALDEGTFAAIDVAEDTAHVALVHQGVPEVARDVFLSGDRGVKSSVEQLLQPREVSSAQTPSGDSLPVPAMPSEQEEHFANLLSELKLSLDYFAREFTGQEIQRVLMCGERANDALKTWLTDELKLPVELATTCPTTGGSPLPSAWTLTLGLALHGVGVAGPRVNFVRHGMQSVTTKSVAIGMPALNVRPIATTMALVSAALIGLFAYKAYQLRDVYEEMAQVRNTRQAVHIPFQAENAHMLRGIKDQIQQRLSLLKAIFSHDVFATTKLASLPRVLPSAVWLNGLHLGASTAQDLSQMSIGLDGLCYMTEKPEELKLVNQLPHELKGHELFIKGLSDVRLKSVRSERDAEYGMTKFAVEADSEKSPGDRRGR